MTVSTTAASVTHNGDGSTTVFSVPFEFFLDADLRVFIGTTEQTLTTDYTVSGGDGSTGSVTFTSAPASGTGNVKIFRWAAFTQTTDFITEGELAAETLEDALDRSIMLIQQVISRAGGVAFDINSTQFLTGSDTIWDADSKRITAVATPTAAGDAATKGYADGLAIAAGNVPTPDDPGDDTKVLTASGGTFDWDNAPTGNTPTPADPGDDGKALKASGGTYVLETPSTFRTSLGLGTAAVEDVGTSSGDIVQLGASGLPAVAGSLVTALSASEGAGLKLISEHTPSAVANLDITGLTSAHHLYIVQLVDITVDTDNVRLSIRVSTDGGSTFKSGATDYQWTIDGRRSSALAIGQGSNGDDEMFLIDSGAGLGIGNAAGEGLQGRIDIWHPSTTTTFKFISGKLVFETADSFLSMIDAGGAYKAAEAINAIQIRVSSGLFSGIVKVYGAKV